MEEGIDGSLEYSRLKQWLYPLHIHVMRNSKGRR
jgi:hypothetical protein